MPARLLIDLLVADGVAALPDLEGLLVFVDLLGIGLVGLGDLDALVHGIGTVGEQAGADTGAQKKAPATLAGALQERFMKERK